MPRFQKASGVRGDLIVTENLRLNEFFQVKFFFRLFTTVRPNS